MSCALEADHDESQGRKADSSLFPRLPLYAGVLITAVDVLIVLAFFNSSKGRQGMLLFEILITSLVRRLTFFPFVLRLRCLIMANCIGLRKISWVTQLTTTGLGSLCELHGAAQAREAQLGRRLSRLPAVRCESATASMESLLTIDSGQTGRSVHWSRYHRR